MDAVNFYPQAEQLFAGRNRLERGLLSDLAPALHHLRFFFDRGVIDEQLEKKTVRLRFRQGVGSFLLDGILRRHDEERLGQRMGFPANRHLALLHRFEESALDLGGCAIDFIGQNEVGEDGTEMRAKLAILRLKYHCADHVAGEQIGRELDTFELHAEGHAERAHEEGLGQAGHTFEQNVPVGQQGHEQALDYGILSDDSFANFITKLLRPGRTSNHEYKKKIRVSVDRSLTWTVGKSFAEKKPTSMDLPTQIQKRLDALGLLARDVQERFVRGSGPGGQKINKTSSTVCLRHGPTQIEVRVQRERSQAANRELAWEELCEKLEARLRSIAAEAQAAREKLRRKNRVKSRTQKARMVGDKRRRGQVKSTRSRVDSD